MKTVTVGGLPGTGTSTLCNILRDRLDLPYVYAGKLFREAAEQRGMSLADFGRLCQEDPTVDKNLDGRQVELLREGGLILEGRLAGWMAHLDNLPAFKVWVTCERNERIRRLSERDGGKESHQRMQTKAREASEKDRYNRYYDIDLDDLSIYDLVIDSTETGPMDLADAVIAALESA